MRNLLTVSLWVMGTVLLSLAALDWAAYERFVLSLLWR